MILLLLLGLLLRSFYAPMTEAKVFGLIVGISLTPLLLNKKKRYKILILALILGLAGMFVIFILDMEGANTVALTQFLSAIMYPWIILLFVISIVYFWQQYRKGEPDDTN